VVVVVHCAGQRLLIHSLLETGEAYKAFDLVADQGVDDIAYYVEVKAHIHQSCKLWSNVF
jgi:hypothetical protein